MHKRAAIRAYMAAAIGAIPTYGALLTQGRVYPEQTSRLPMLDLMPVSETLDETQTTQDATGVYRQARIFLVQVTIGTAGDAYLDALETIAFEVEKALMADPLMGGLVDFIEAQDSEWEQTGETETPVGFLRTEYEVRYQVNAQDPQ